MISEMVSLWIECVVSRALVKKKKECKMLEALTVVLNTLF